MATSKGSEEDYNLRQGEKIPESTVSRRTQKLKSSDPIQVIEKKLTRAKTRIVQSDNDSSNQSSVNKALENVGVIGEILKDWDGVEKLKTDSENTSPKKQSEILGSPKKESISPVKDVESAILSKGDAQNVISPKRDAHSVISPKKEIQSVSPRKEMQSSPNKEVLGLSPKKEMQSPQKKEIQSVSPRKEMQSSPNKEVQGLSPKKEMQSPQKKEIQSVSPRKEMQSSPNKEVQELSPKKEMQSPQKKEVQGLSPKKEVQRASPKKVVQSLTITNQDEVTLVKSRKVKVKLLSAAVPKKKLRDRSNSKSDDVNVVVTTEKVKNKDDKIKGDKKENRPSDKTKTEKNREIVSSNVTLSVDDKSPLKLAHSPTVAGCATTAGNNKENGWSPGDLAWGRVGQYPFWPCMIATDHETGEFTKTKRVGRGLNSIQQSFHVQFFGDNGRHSWIPNACVIKYEGKEQFLTLAEKVLHKMKKKDKKYSSAFIVKHTAKTKWEIAVGEAEKTVSKTREERIEFFQKFLPTKKSFEKSDSKQKSLKEEEPKEEELKVQLVRKRRRPIPIVDEEQSKQAKMGRIQTAAKAAGGKEKLQNTLPNTPTRKKHGRNKIIKKKTGNPSK